jgi:hypothetical protein
MACTPNSIEPSGSRRAVSHHSQATHRIRERDLIARLQLECYTLSMGKVTHGIFFAAVMIVTIVAVDLLFFRHHTAARLMANVGIVLLYLAFYWRFFKKN